MFFHGTNQPLSVGTKISYRNGPDNIHFQSLRGAAYFTSSSYKVPKGEADGTVTTDDFIEGTPDSKRLRAISSAVTYAVRAVSLYGLHPQSLSLAPSHNVIYSDAAGVDSDVFYYENTEDHQRVLRNHKLFGLSTKYVISDEEWEALPTSEQHAINASWPSVEVRPLRGIWVYQVEPHGNILNDGGGHHWSDRYTKGHLKIVDVIVNDGVFVQKKNQPLTHEFVIPGMTTFDRQLIRKLRHP